MNSMVLRNDKYHMNQSMMDQDLENYDSSANNVCIKSPKTMTKSDKGKRSNKCNQCDSQAVDLRRHLKMHIGEKSNKCNQCDYASCYESALRAHFKTHSGEKQNKCNQCDYASCYASALRTHSKTHSGEK